VKISIIVAYDENGLIGLSGGIPWDLPEDRRRFKAITTGSAVIMGRKTFQSIGEKPLPGRMNIIVSANMDYMSSEFSDTYDAASLEDAITYFCFEDTEPDAFIIGGARLFNEGMKIADKLYITTVDQVIEPNDTAVYFKPDLTGFTKISESPREGYTFHVYERTEND
jgi:dihydrofolate reductase